jgi:hypothetical protein
MARLTVGRPPRRLHDLLYPAAANGRSVPSGSVRGELAGHLETLVAGVVVTSDLDIRRPV